MSIQEVWSGRFADFLRRKFLMRGQLQLQIPGEVQPSITLNDADLFPADHFPLGQHLVGVAQERIGVAAQLSRIAISVPAGAGIIYENRAIMIAGTAAMQVVFFHDGVALANTASVMGEDSRDDRFAFIAGQPPTMEADNNVASAGGQTTGTMLVNLQIVLPYQFVLHPGHRFSIETAAVNTLLSVGFFGWWRNLAPGEA